MSKGKKFTAAEKHFLEKENQYRKEIRRLDEALAKALTANVTLAKKNVSLQEELTKVAAERDEALKLSNLSTEELQRHIKATQNVSQAVGMFTCMNQRINRKDYM